MKHVILILGMHRSGTSALTRVVSLMGAALPKSILGKNHSNLRGHWESEVLIKSHEAFLARFDSDWKDWQRLKMPRKTSLKAQSFIEEFQTLLESEFSKADDVWLVKEPRICRFASLYIDALKEASESLHSVIMVRNPLEVAASLEARDDMNKLDALHLWLTHMLEAEIATRGERRSMIAYDDFLMSPVKTAQKLSKDFDFSLPYNVNDVKSQIESYVSPSLKRQSLASEDVALDPIARGWVSQAYEALCVLCANPYSETAMVKLDDVRASYFAALSPLHDIISYEREHHKRLTQEELSRANTRYEAATQAYKAEQKKAWTERDSEYDQAWQARDDSHKSAIQDLIDKHQLETEKWNEREAEFEKIWKERDAENTKLWVERDERHAQEIAALTDDRNALQTEWHDERAALMTSHKSELDRLNLEQSQSLEGLQSKHEVAIEGLKSENDHEIENLKSDYHQRVESLKAEHEAVTERMGQEISFMRDEFGEILRASDMRADTNAAEAQTLRHDLSAVLNSTSWKMTGGLRRLLDTLKGLKRSGPKANLESPPRQPRLEFKSSDQSD